MSEGGLTTEDQISEDRDHSQTQIVRVPLFNRPGAMVRLEKADFDRFVAAGHSTRWRLNQNGKGHYYVRFKTPEFVGRNETVARVILGAGPGQQVEYVNGDRLDLRRENLRIGKSGKARGQTLAGDEFGPPPVAKVETPALPPVAPPAPRRSKPLDMIVTRPPNPRMRPEGTMGLPEATSGFAFAPA